MVRSEKSHIGFCCGNRLLVIKSAFIYLGKYLVFIFEIYFIVYRILGSPFFSTKLSCHYFLTCIISREKRCCHLSSSLSLYNIYFFLWLVLRFSLHHLFLNNLIMVCLGVVLFTVSGLGIYWPPWKSGFIVFYESEKCSAIIYVFFIFCAL